MKQRIIAPDVWDLFLRRLEEIKWRGMVGFHHYAEPTLIPGFLNYIREIKARVPTCLPVVFSNGDRPEVLDEVLGLGIFRCYITQHPPTTARWLPPVLELKRKYGWHVRIGRITSPHNQAGNVRTVVAEPFTKCIDEPNALTIDIDGNHLICCLDYYHEHKFCNIRDGSLRQIWYLPSAVEARRKLAAGIPATKLCHGCFQMEYKEP